MATRQSDGVNSHLQVSDHQEASAQLAIVATVNLDDFRWNLAAAYSVVKVAQLAVEGNPDTPHEAIWRTLAVAANLTELCLDEFDSDAFAAAWAARKAVRP